MKQFFTILACLGVWGYTSACVAAAPHQKIYLKSGETIEGWVERAPDGSVNIQEGKTRHIHNYPRADVVRIEEYGDGGNLFKVYNYQNGLKDGEYKIYSRDGTLYEEGSYAHDQPDGVARQYFENGQVRWEKTYRDGKLVRREEHDRTGALISQRNYEGGAGTEQETVVDPLIQTIRSMTPPTIRIRNLDAPPGGSMVISGATAAGDEEGEQQFLEYLKSLTQLPGFGDIEVESLTPARGADGYTLLFTVILDRESQ